MLSMLQTCKFRPGDAVNVRIPGTDRFEDGPYLVAFVPKYKKYVLSFSDGRIAKGGRKIDEDDLQAVTDI